MSNKGTVLVIDDEKDVIELVRVTLEKEGYDVIAAHDGATGLEIAAKHDVELILLDLMMPGLDGLEVCRRLRSEPQTQRIPILMLTAKATESDKIVGLEMGADDYMIKPFSTRELVARVRALLRRSSIEQTPADVLRQGELVIDANRHEVTYRGKPVELTATEFRILEFLAGRPGRVLSRDQIIDTALGREAAVFDRTVDVHITAIRRKLGEGGDQIETIRGFGYKFSDRAAPRTPAAHA